MLELRERFRGCLLGGAVGDALGADVEFDSLASIRSKHGDQGPRDLGTKYRTYGAITDDTQMTFFTVEGLLRADVSGRERGVCNFEEMLHRAYLRWLVTQQKAGPHTDPDSAYSYLLSIPALHARRAPGSTCLSALEANSMFGSAAQNNSKGCGGVMRIAPVGLYHASLERDVDAKLSFELAARAAGLTHGHPTGQLASGVFAVIIQRLAEGKKLSDAIEEADAIVHWHPDNQETRRAMNMARERAAQSRPSAEAVESLGAGWVAEEALAISLYCALVARDFEHGVRLAVTHSGDSDSTGSMVGQLLGTALGEGVIPKRWGGAVELGWLALELADDLFERSRWYFEEGTLPAIWTKYPGC